MPTMAPTFNNNNTYNNNNNNNNTTLFILDQLELLYCCLFNQADGHAIHDYNSSKTVFFGQLF